MPLSQPTYFSLCTSILKYFPVNTFLYPIYSYFLFNSVFVNDDNNNNSNNNHEDDSNIFINNNDCDVLILSNKQTLVKRTS